jgi:hypothetical protein
LGSDRIAEYVFTYLPEKERSLEGPPKWGKNSIF